MTVSLIMPFHNNPGMLEYHYRHTATLPADVRAGHELVLCDDASDPAERALHPFGDIGVNVSIFRIPPPHVPWSHRVATNIAAREAINDWLLVTDIDHVVPLDTWRYVLARLDRLRADRAYTFTRRNMDGADYKSHPDSWLFHRLHWERVGGYDERYRGLYGQNMPFINRVERAGPIECLQTPLVRVSRDEIPDASERVLERKNPHTREVVASLRRQFVREGTFYKDTRGSVSYEKVAP